MRVPETIGEYRLGRELGRGGMGVVFEASRPGLPPLALKLLSPGVALDGDSLERFLREGRLLARVEHDNVLRIHDLDRSSVGPYIVTDRIEGESLDTLRRTGGLPPRRAAEVVAQVADGVAAIHARGILHRDLKPENVVLRPDGVPVLLDFGLARELDGSSLTQTGTVLGTPAYMAPEQAGGDKPDALTVAVDVYGLGAILFTLLAGRPPHEASSLIEILSKVLNEPLSWPAGIDAGAPLRAIVERALAKQPEARFDSAAELAAALRDWLDQEAWGAAPASARSTGWLALAAVLIGALGVGVFVLASSRASVAPAESPVAASEAAPRAKAEPSPAPTPRAGPKPSWYERYKSGQPPWPLPAGVRLSGREEEFLNTRDASALVWVPPGLAQLGAVPRKRRHRFEQGFFMGKFEITRHQYQTFLTKTGQTAPSTFTNSRWKQPNHPALGVPFAYGAMLYAFWAGARLPTPDEWEYAARGPKGLRYPWGDEPSGSLEISRSRAVFEEGPRLVGSFAKGASPFGCLDMAGNAIEYAYGTARNREGDLGVQARGGAFNFVQDASLWAQAHHYAAADWDRGEHHSGFRIVVDAE